MAITTVPDAPQRPTAVHHSLPRWFLVFQDHVGLSLLVIALMCINGVVYASGVVPNINDRSTWSPLGTLLVASFFLAGMATPGIALRAGVGIFHGRFGRRFACFVMAVSYFAVEVWASVTERSLNTITTPADKWLMDLVGAPSLPFSPTVLAISLALSIAVIGWGIVVTPPPSEDAEDVDRKERIRTLRAQHAAQRRAIQAAGAMGAIRAGRLAFTGAQAVPSPANSVSWTPLLQAGNDGDDDETENDDGDAGSATGGTGDSGTGTETVEVQRVGLRRVTPPLGTYGVKAPSSKPLRTAK